MRRVNQGSWLALPGLRRVREVFLKEEIAKERPKNELEFKVEKERMFLEEGGKHMQRLPGIN